MVTFLHCCSITIFSYHYTIQTSQSNHTRTTALSNSVKPSHASQATQDRRVMVERSDRMWSAGEGNGKPLQYSCPENPMNNMKMQKDRILKEELPRWVGAQYATGDQRRNNSRKNEGMEPKQKQYPVVDATGDRSKVRCCKEQYCMLLLLSLQSCLTLCDPIEGSLPGSPVPGILQARTLEWVAIAFSNA